MPFHFLQQKHAPAAEVSPREPAVGLLLSSILPLNRADTLGKVLYQLQHYRVSALPVVDASSVIGWVSEAHLAELLLNNSAAEERLVEDAMEPAPALLQTDDSLSHALTIFQATGAPLLPVLWSDGRFQGIVTRAEALMARAGKIPAPRIGGMATPLGVYLTTGVVRGGVGDGGLVLTGVVMAFFLSFAQTLVRFLAACGYNVSHIGLLRDIYLILADKSFTSSPTMDILVSTLTSALLIAVFLLFLRFMPRMAGFHAAEHQTVNAIEGGEQLTPSAVARMPRVHPRCGTNLWGLVMLTYLAVTVISLLLSTPLGRENLGLVVSLAIVASLGVVISWRTMGAWLQSHFTTRPASPAEIASGIRAGEEVLYRHQTTPYRPPTLAQRLLQMGLLQVIVGITLTGTLLQVVDNHLDFLWGFLVK